MRVSPRYRRIAKGVAAGVVGLAIPLDKIVLAVMLIGQFRSIWIQEMQHEEEVRARVAVDSGVGGDRGGRLGTQAPLMRILVGLLPTYRTR